MRRSNCFIRAGIAALGLTVLLPASVQASPNSGHWVSSYSTLQDSGCKVEVSTDDHYLATCKGIAGYKLEIDNSKNGLALTVVDPKGNPFRLSGYKADYVADLAEWHGPVRRGKIDPEALILQLSSPLASDPSKMESSLLVVRLDESGICATNLIEKSTGSGEMARDIAKEARGKPCLPAFQVSAAY